MSIKENTKITILIVDDILGNIDVLYNILKDHYNIQVATNGIKALELAFNTPTPDLILLDVVMPAMNGFEVCQRLKATILTRKIPIIFVTSQDEEIDEQHGLSLGAVDYIRKPVNPAIVLSRVKNHLALYDQQKHLESLVKERTAELNQTRLKIIRKLGKAGEFRDNETGMHVIRMSKFCQLLALKIGLSSDEADLLLNIAPLHDIGKIGIPDHVLLKPGGLNADEWEIMKKHTTIGAEIIGDDDSEILREAKSCALTHHEKWNGEGYPCGLKETAIPLYGRIAAVADVFDALTSERPYKKIWPVEDAIALLKREKGKHFDPQLVDAFLAIMPQVLLIKEKFKDR